MIVTFPNKIDAHMTKGYRTPGPTESRGHSYGWIEAISAEYCFISPDSSSCRRRHLSDSNKAFRQTGQVGFITFINLYFRWYSIRCLAPLHGLEYATPSLIALAARKIYLHRIEIVEPERERSLQWGSDLNAIQELLDGVGPEDVIEDVLGSSGVEPPL